MTGENRVTDPYLDEVEEAAARAAAEREAGAYTEPEEAPSGEAASDEAPLDEALAGEEPAREVPALGQDPFAETPYTEALAVDHVPADDLGDALEGASDASTASDAFAQAAAAAASAMAGADHTGEIPDFLEVAQAALDGAHADEAASAPDAEAPARPDTTAEIDVSTIEAHLNDPGSTQSFEAIPEERINTDSTYDAGTTCSLMWGARSDVGCVRTHNEDSYLVQSPLFCVCDGMGGHAAGEVASSIAVETIARHAPQEADPARLAAAVERANTAIIEATVTGLGKPGMGCTATAAYIDGHAIAIAHVGDSRAYLLHEGTLIRITHDHSYVEELVDAGEITADEARVHPNRSVITRALGSDPAMYADHFQLNIEEGDRLILCSDGLSSMIADAEIENIAAQSPTAQICTDNLVDAALAAGGADNVTVVVVDVVDDGRMRELSRRRVRNIAIAAASLLLAIIVALGVSSYVISHAVFLGVEGEHVAIYTGIPNSFMGLELFELSDETNIEVADLPEDTQNRLRAGISQSSMDEARQTVSSYRQQIDAEQTRAAQDAAAIHAATTTEGGDL